MQDFIVGIFVGAAVAGAVLAVGLMATLSDQVPKQEAVERGYAAWVADQKTGKAEFKWKEAK